MESRKGEVINDLFKKICCIGLAVIIIWIFFDFNSTEKYTVMDFEDGFYAMDFGDSPNSFTTSNNDARMSIDLPRTYVDDVEIKLTESVDFNWRCQLYYTLNDDETFNEENSIEYNVKAGEQIIDLKLKKKISGFRIDWGDESGKIFSVDSIVVNPYARFNRICLTILLAIALFLIFELVVCLKDMISRLFPTGNKIVIRRILCVCAVELFVFCSIISILHGNNGIVEFWKFLRGPRTSNLSMTFTSLNFLFLFFPLCISGYYLLKEKYRDVFLVLASFLFYSVGEPKMVWLLFTSIVINYLFGLGLGKKEEGKAGRYILLAVMLLWNFGVLFYYKYYVFSLETAKSFTGKSVFIPEIIQPLGLSFFTFRMVSFCMDVYWGTVPEQKNFIKVALYISFFPQLVMGPISKYNDFSRNLGVRKFDVGRVGGGIKRIIAGLFKKLVIADTIASTVDIIFGMGSGERTVLLAWIGIAGYLIQLYYDFSGYSDIAIGIGNLLGFDTPENFNYPYMSKSVTEFWARWHITLGAWLKNYLYTPIFRACQDRSINKLYCDILALIGVWLFAGIWHGAGWNYLLYGVYYCVFIILERLWASYKKRKRKKLGIKKQPETAIQKARAHLYFIIVLIVGQLIFRSSDLVSFGTFFLDLFGLSGNAIADAATMFYWKQSAAVFALGMVFCFPIVPVVKKILSTGRKKMLLNVAEPVVYGVLLLMAAAFAFTSTYQAFVYFQF